ncbi:MAG TPA: hypothetical protein VHE33_09425, partial [Acidobacteriaceae bacterium]|nr:hypothetical protein [Acidobacteriaceae bacterium]
MRVIRLVGAAVLIGACLPVAVAMGQDTTAAVTVVHCPSLFDSAAGKMLGPTTVVIAGDKFEKVESGTQSEPGATVIE